MPYPVLPAPPFQPAVDLGPVSAVTVAQAKAYAIADRLRAARWQVVITITNTGGKPGEPAVRTVELAASRFDDDDVLAASWVGVVAGARRGSHARAAHLRRPGTDGAHRVVAAHDLARWVVTASRVLPEHDDRRYATLLLGCRECGTTDVLHADGCRICAYSVPQLVGYQPGGKIVPRRVGYSVFRAGTDERAAAGVFPSVDHAVAWAEELGGAVALDVRPVR